MTAATATMAAPRADHDLPVARPARVTGVRDLTLAILGGLARLYVRPRAIVPGDAATTAAPAGIARFWLIAYLLLRGKTNPHNSLPPQPDIGRAARSRREADTP